MTDAQTGDPGRDSDSDIRLSHWPSRPGSLSRSADPLVAALARYVQALHRRYPEGPEQLHRESLDGRAKVSRMLTIRKGTAA